MEAWSRRTDYGRSGGRRFSNWRSGAAPHGLRVFGPVARGVANENSNLDLLVAWEPGRTLLDHARLVQDLQELRGMKVHVGTAKALHWYVRAGFFARRLRCEG
jgi:predicted nucleotidyltransferase